jgi:hypothetical protein
MQLNEQFLRMQKLAGITANDADIELANLLTEIHLHEHFYSKGILKENVNEGQINEAFSTILDKVKKLGKSGKEKLVGVLLGKLKALVGNNNYDKVLALFKITNKEEFKKAANTFGEKLEKNIAEAEDKEEGTGKVKYSEGFKKIFSTLALSIYILVLGLGIAGKVSAGNIEPVKDNKTPTEVKTTDNPEKITSDALKLVTGDKIDGDGDNTDGDSIKKGGEPKVDSSEPDADGKISTDVQLGTGDGTMSAEKTAEAAKTTADNIVKSIEAAEKAEGGKTTSVDLEVGGSIDDIGKDTGNENNPNEPGKTDLKKDRTELGQKILQDAIKILKAKYPNVKFNVKTFDNKDIKAGVGIDIEKIEVKKTDNPPPPDVKKTDTAPDAEGFLRNTRIATDGNVYEIILGFILPLIMDDKTYDENIKSKITKDTIPDKTINDTYVDQYIKKYPKELKTIEILNWVKGVKKAPSSLLKNFGDLDSNLKDKLTRIKGYQGRPGSGTTQGSDQGQETSPKGTLEESISLLEIYKRLLLEGTSFSDLKGYDAAKAKSNLGILVPMYLSTWQTNEKFQSAEIDKEGSGVLGYVAKTYPESFRKFEKDYPIFLEKVNIITIPDEKATQEKGKETDAKVDAKQPGEKPVVPAKTDVKVDAKTDANTKTDANAKVANTATSADIKSKNPLTPDSDRVGSTIEKNPSLKRTLALIDKPNELGELIFAILSTYVDNSLKTYDKQKAIFNTLVGRINSKYPNASLVRTATNHAKKLFTTKYPDEKSYSPISNDSPTSTDFKEKDTTNILTQLKSMSVLKTALSKINTPEEAIQVIIREFIPFLGKTFYSQDRTPLGRFGEKTLKETPLNEQFLRMQKLAGLITESQYQARKK